MRALPVGAPALVCHPDGSLTHVSIASTDNGNDGPTVTVRYLGTPRVFGFKFGGWIDGSSRVLVSALPGVIEAWRREQEKKR